MAESDQRKRREVCYQGMVQGVGFRYTTRQVAAGFNVTGYVQNLPDGRVHLVAEGEDDELQAFLESIQQRLGHYIADVEESSSRASGQLSGFEIRH
jgi:acylphosphatase